MSDADSQSTDAVGTVLASGYRRRTVAALSETDATPSQIAERNGDNVSHVSRALKELRELDVVELLVPEDRHKGRLYGLTDRGERVAERVAEIRDAQEGS